MAADDPRRAQARRAARAAYGKRNGPARVARMAAADLGARSDEAARVLARKSSVAVLRRLIRHKESAVRAGVAMALAHRPRLGPALLTELLGDRNLRVIRLAVRSAARLGDRRVVGRLAKLALRYERSIRGAALRVLAHHASIPVARRKLIEAFNHRSAAVREDAVVAVGLGGATWARYWLGRRARDRSSAVRRSVARALGRLPPAASAIRVLRRLSRDRSPRVRKAARRARRELRRARRAAARARRESRRRRLRRRKRGRRAGRPGASAPRRSAP
jgi:HEAT repeat protein